MSTFHNKCFFGAIKDGKTEYDNRNFKVHRGDKDGKELDIEVWNATQILSDNCILPKGYDVREFSFMVPANAAGPMLTIGQTSPGCLVMTH